MSQFRLPNRAVLGRLSLADARGILDTHERDVREIYPDDDHVTYDFRGRGYHRRLSARKLKRILAARDALGL